MSYKITRNGKDYEFENQAKYEEFYNQAKEKARDNNLSTAQAFNVLYTPYVAPTNTETPSTPTTNYGSLIDNAEAYKNAAYANAEGVKNASYAQALKAREEAEALAEIQRKRGVVDASTMAAQERATYGANAEALGRMGLNVSGYSDYLNSQAYASGMAARQSANAQATEMNRQASYAEALARLDADKAYSQATAEADKTYYGMLNEIESAKIADAQAQEQQKQTNYQNFLASIDGETTPEMIDILAKYNGVTDASEIKSAKDYASALKTANGTTETTPTVNEDAVAKVFSHQEGDETVVNTEYQVKDEYKKAKELHDKDEMDDATWRVIDGTYKMEYDNTENYVSVYSQTYDENSFGKFNSGKDQTKLLEDIVGMVEGKVLTNKGEKLKENDEILVNVGNGNQKSYMYLGNGLFKETELSPRKEDYVVPEDFLVYGDALHEVVRSTGIVDVNEDSAAKKFGNFIGSGNKDSEQSKYINTIIEDAKQGKITKGQKVIVNYGTTGRGTYVYEYIGKGKFINTGKNYVYASESEDLYNPDGYTTRTRSDNGLEIIKK